jgi:pyrimidine-nucleoside phosphorylase
MLKLAGQGKEWVDEQETSQQLIQTLDGGSAFAKFRAMVEAQHGDVRMIDNPSLLPLATMIERVPARSSGYIQQVAADEIGKAALLLGAGRDKKGDRIDMAVGLEIFAKVGEYVEAGTTIAVIHANDEMKLSQAREFLDRAVQYSATPVEPLPLFYDEISGMAERN